MAVILQVDFIMPAKSLAQQSIESLKMLAESIAKEPGFISKIWTENSQTNEAGGIYLFENGLFAEKYLTMHQKRLEAMGAQKIRSKIFTINDTLTAITKGSLNW